MSNNKILSIFLGLVLIGVSVFCYFNFFKTSDNKKEESSKGTVITATKFEADIYFDDLVFDKGVKYQAFRGPDGEHLEIYQTL